MIIPCWPYPQDKHKFKFDFKGDVFRFDPKRPGAKVGSVGSTELVQPAG